MGPAAGGVKIATGSETILEASCYAPGCVIRRQRPCEWEEYKNEVPRLCAVWFLCCHGEPLNHHVYYTPAEPSVGFTSAPVPPHAPDRQSAACGADREGVDK